MSYSVFDYATMVADRPRADAFDAALRQTVKPGDVVLELGTGTGIFALQALRHGAGRVYAIEPNPAIQVARRLAEVNGVSDRIVFIEAMSIDVELPERADVLLSDIRGALPLHCDHVPAIVDARARHLAEGGTLIPRSDTLFVVPVGSPEAWNHYVGRWRESHFDLDTEPLEAVLANTLHSGRPDGMKVLGAPRVWGRLDYDTVTSGSLHGSAEWTLDEAGTLYGYHLWFDMVLADGISFSNAPDRPTSVYGSLFLALARPLDLASGDRLSVRLLADLVNDEYIWRWETAATRSGRAETLLRQSTLQGALLSPSELHLREAGHLPRLSPRAALDHDVLGALRRGGSLGEIAKKLSAAHPTRFPAWQQALAYVSDVYLRYADRDGHSPPGRSGGA